jgi:inosose dehydratase
LYSIRHVATYVETPLELEHLFAALAASSVGLCLDTGHCVYGGGDPREEAQKYKPLLRYVHIKDVNPGVLEHARQQKLDFEAAVGAGVFCPTGTGCIDFAGFFRFLADSQYSGWAVVEQDVIYGKTTAHPLDSMRASLDYLKDVIAKT